MHFAGKRSAFLVYWSLSMRNVKGGLRQLRQLPPRITRWLRQHRTLVRRTGYGVLFFAGLTIVFQLAYPAGRVLPFVTVEGYSLQGQTTTEARKQLDKRYAKAKLSLKTQDKTFDKSFEEIGIDPESWNTARSAARYTFGQRLIPFSSVYIMIKRDTPMQVSFDDDRLNYFSQEVEKEGFVGAVNASITVKDGKVDLASAKPSKAYPAKKVAGDIRSAAFVPHTEVKVAPKTTPAERTDDEVKGVLDQAERAVNTPLTLKVANEDHKVQKTTIGTWLDFTEEADTKKLQLSLKTAEVQKYLESIQGKVYKAPGTTKIQIIDGREAGKTEGAPGQGIDVEKTIGLLNEAFKKGDEKTLDVPIAQLPPKVEYVRSYSNSDAGLLAVLNEVAGGKNMSISVMTLSGRNASVGGTKKFVAASTYKLYVAYAVFKQIEAGQLAWGTPVGGRTVEGCFEVMIVRSDNPCAKALGDRIGWQRVEDMVRGIGMVNTELSPSLLTTANDLALFMYKLENGSLVSAADKARLVDAMKRQIYRSGVPAGTGLSVANKPGFIDGYIHDPAIVYGPRGPYVVVIMTSGSSWSSIASAAKQINTFLNQ